MFHHDCPYYTLRSIKFHISLKGIDSTLLTFLPFWTKILRGKLFGFTNFLFALEPTLIFCMKNNVFIFTQYNNPSERLYDLFCPENGLVNCVGKRLNFNSYLGGQFISCQFPGNQDGGLCNCCCIKLLLAQL